jgi:hypothetical protein
VETSFLRHLLSKIQTFSKTGSGQTWKFEGKDISAGDRALPFNMSSLPANVHNDLDVTIVFGGRGGLATGDYVIHRLVRFARVTTASSKVRKTRLV